MAGKRYRAKDRTVAKMERTGLVEENVRTGEKTRTSEGSTREITFEGRSDSGRREDPAVQNVRFAKNPVLIGSKSYFCSSQDCRFVI